MTVPSHCLTHEFDVRTSVTVIYNLILYCIFKDRICGHLIPSSKNLKQWVFFKGRQELYKKLFVRPMYSAFYIQLRLSQWPLVFSPVNTVSNYIWPDNINLILVFNNSIKAVDPRWIEQLSLSSSQSSSSSTPPILSSYNYRYHYHRRHYHWRYGKWYERSGSCFSNRRGRSCSVVLRQSWR